MFSLFGDCSFIWIETNLSIQKKNGKHKIIYLNDLFNYFLPDLGAYLGIYLLDYLLWIHLKIYYFVLVS